MMMRDLQVEAVAGGGGEGRKEIQDQQFLEGEAVLTASVVPIAQQTPKDDYYSSIGITLPFDSDTDSDAYSLSPVRSIPSSEDSEVNPEDFDSDNVFTKIGRVVQQSSGTDRTDRIDLKEVVERIRSVRLQYKIPWNAAAEILFYRLIKSALKLHHSSEGEFKDHIDNMLIKWKVTLKHFFPTRFSEVDALMELEKVCLKAKMSFPVFPTILSCLYEHKIISKRAIVYWARDTFWAANIGWGYTSNESFVKESSEFIKTLKQGLCVNNNKIELYGSDEVFEGHGYDYEDCNSEVGKVKTAEATSKTPVPEKKVEVGKKRARAKTPVSGKKVEVGKKRARAKTPVSEKKVEVGKKRARASSASKTPVSEKKAKLETPVGKKSDADGKKGGHIATPYPKQAAKEKTFVTKEKSKQQSPKSGSAVSCKSCSKTFTSETALQSHTKAKHEAQQSPKSDSAVFCKSCLKTFTSETALQSHTKAKHKASCYLLY